MYLTSTANVILVVGSLPTIKCTWEATICSYISHLFLSNCSRHFVKSTCMRWAFCLLYASTFLPAVHCLRVLRSFWLCSKWNKVLDNCVPLSVFEEWCSIFFTFFCLFWGDKSFAFCASSFVFSTLLYSITQKTLQQQVKDHLSHWLHVFYVFILSIIPSFGVRIGSYQQWSPVLGQCDQCLGWPETEVLPRPLPWLQDHPPPQGLTGRQRSYGDDHLPESHHCWSAREPQCSQVR